MHHHSGASLLIVGYLLVDYGGAEISATADFLRVIFVDEMVYQYDQQAAPWYRHSLAYLSYIILGLTGVTGLVYQLMRKIRRREAELEAEVAQRNRELAELKEQTAQESEVLKELDEAKSRFFAHISHELKTPLALISGPLSDLQSQEQLRKNPKIRQEFNRITHNVQHLDKMVRQLLDLARLEFGELQISPEPVNATASVHRIVEAFRSKVDEHELSIEVNGPDKELLVDADPVRLEQVLINLIDNAIKFTESEGRIDIDVHAMEDELHITVADTGIGIPEELYPCLFKRFYKIDNGHERRHEGTGMGLAIASEIVNYHNGSLKVESQPGEGSTFTVALPLSQMTTEEISNKLAISPPDVPVSHSSPDEPIAAHASRNGEAIPVLVVEDHPEMAMYLQKLLEDEGYTVEIARNGIEAFDRIDKRPPRLIITDVMMPEMDGFTFVRDLQTMERFQHLPIIFITALDERTSKMEALRMGIDDYLTKPFDAPLLKKRVAGLLEADERRRNWIAQNGVTYDRAREEVNSKVQHFLEQARRYVMDNIREPGFGPAELADALHTSQRQLNRDIRELTGHTPQQFIQSIRMEYAWQLAEQSGFTRVSELAEACAYRDADTFSKNFKKHYGVPPSARLRQPVE